MFNLLKTYCQFLSPYQPIVFFAVGISILLLFIGVLLLNPYRKTIKELSCAKKSLLRRSKKQNVLFARKPSCYGDGWDIFCSNHNLLPANCLIFKNKKPFYLFELLILAEIFALTPVSLLAGINESFGWQFFVPFVYMAIFLAIFQTHRLIFKSRAEKATEAHFAFIKTLDELIEKGFSPVAEGTKRDTKKKKRLELRKNARINSGFISQAQEEQPQKNHEQSLRQLPPPQTPAVVNPQMRYLIQQGIEENTAREITERLEQPPEQRNANQRKKLDELLDCAFQKVCQNTVNENNP